PALVVEIVAGRLILRAETGERAVDDALGQLRGADPETVDDAGPEALEHDVGAGAERAAVLGLRLQVELDGLLAGVERLVPGRRGAPRAGRAGAPASDPRPEAAAASRALRAASAPGSRTAPGGTASGLLPTGPPGVAPQRSYYTQPGCRTARMPKRRRKSADC